MASQARRAEDYKCVCGEVQNVVHILSCTEVGGGKGRTLAQIDEDPDFARGFSGS